VPFGAAPARVDFACNVPQFGFRQKVRCRGKSLKDAAVQTPDVDVQNNDITTESERKDR
jgi:hypothetical protein